MQTGENEQALRKILDMTRWISIVLLVIHCYYFLYTAFQEWQLTSSLTDRILSNIKNTGLFGNFHKSKIISLLFLIISLIGSRGKKDEKINFKKAISYVVSGILLYFFSFLFLLPDMKPGSQAILYIVLLSVGFLLILSGGTLLSRIITQNLGKDIFNIENETFPQETRLITNEYSINLPTLFRYKGRQRKGFLNVISPQRGVICQGSAGSGKTAYFLRHVITQCLAKEEPFSMLVYDFKFVRNEAV